MSISIITRSLRSSELENFVNNLVSRKDADIEIIAVSKINDHDLGGNINLIVENSNRFEAKITGIKNAKYDKILFLDSDQVPQEGLLTELDDKDDDMVIIPERSLNNNFTARCLDDWRFRNERIAMKNPNPYIPVIPRFFKKEYVMKAIEIINPKLYNVITHEDSILYYEVYKLTKRISFSKKYIYNNDPPFSLLMKKAFYYGKNYKEIKSSDIPFEIVDLIDRLDMNTLNFRELGIGKGYIIQILRGMMYKLGSLSNQM
ncbi:MAG: hypothetical protein QW292_05315 [Candidatus Parvarchaeota archaeon]